MLVFTRKRDLPKFAKFWFRNVGFGYKVKANLPKFAKCWFAIYIGSQILFPNLREKLVKVNLPKLLFFFKMKSSQVCEILYVLH